MMTQIRTPTVRAKGVPSNARLMPMEMKAESTVQIEPEIEAARPAILPIGSIESALRLPKVKPTRNMTEVAQMKNIQKGKLPVVS